jgi:hypothetical protein
MLKLFRGEFIFFFWSEIDTNLFFGNAANATVIFVNRLQCFRSVIPKFYKKQLLGL